MNAALFDIDGTLVDSNDAHAMSWQEALGEVGIKADYAKLRRAIGMGGDHLLPWDFDLDPESEKGKNLSKRRGEIFRASYLNKVTVFSQAHDLLRELRARGLKVVVATSASKEDSAAILKHAQLEALIDVVTNSGDAEHSKPDPDILLAALEKAGVRRAEAFMVGDTPYDLTAAKRAGLESIGFKSGGWDASDLRDAAEIYAGPADFLAHVRQNLSALVSPARGLHPS